MKHTIISLGKNLRPVLLATLLSTIGLVPLANAQKAVKVGAAQSVSQAVTFSGIKGNHVYFVVKLDRPIGEKAMLRIIDATGEALYAAEVEGGVSEKSFAFPLPEEKERISFVLRQGRGSESVATFELKPAAQVVMSATVVKL